MTARDKQAATDASMQIAEMTIDMLIYFQQHSDGVTTMSLIDAFSQSLQEGHDMAAIMLTMITKAVEESKEAKQ